MTSDLLWSLYVANDWTTSLLVFASLCAAYVVFGIAGFGAALISAPVLAHRIPVANVVPLLALLDFVAAVTQGFNLKSKIDVGELLRLVPMMVIGSLCGIMLLMSLPSNVAAVALGFFAVGYGIYGFFPRANRARIKPGWVVPLGLLGGVMSGLFGSGGFVYALYLGRRLEDKDAMRATQSTLIGLATATRAAIFLFAGSYSDMKMVAMAIAGLPAIFLGLYIGHHISLRLTREQFFRVLCAVSIVTGSSLIVRFLF